MLKNMIRLSIFVLCGQLLLYFRPKDSYEKYFKLLIQLMIMLQFLTPFVSFFKGEAKQDVGAWVEGFFREMEENWKEKYDRKQYGGEWMDEMKQEGGDGFEDGSVRQINIPPVVIKDIEVEDGGSLEKGVGGEEDGA